MSSEIELYRFQYQGQWWDFMSIRYKLVYIFILLTMPIAFYEGAVERDKYKLPNVLNPHGFGDTFMYGVPGYIEM